ncbi:hypothetical protein L7F22_050939 [Adiantum nelumboides]|nr:hypothetical protein [Adiantum nelumboides]
MIGMLPPPRGPGADPPNGFYSCPPQSLQHTLSVDQETLLDSLHLTPHLWITKEQNKLQRSRHAPRTIFASYVDVADPARPAHAEAAQTVADVCNEGVLCTSIVFDGWPIGSAIRFAVEPENDSPFFYFPPSTFHTQHLQGDNRCRLHIQLEKLGHRKPQCTFKGHVSKVEGALNQKLRTFGCS